MVDLEGTRSLPPRGKGYRTYSYFGSALGRQYAHHKVIETLQDAFANLHETTGQTFDVAKLAPNTVVNLVPHFTHREGMSVNIMTPMKKGDKPARLSTGPMSLWGYCWHIDAKSNRQHGLKWDAPPTVTTLGCALQSQSNLRKKWTLRFSER